jgi:hypothetical protein
VSLPSTARTARLLSVILVLLAALVLPPLGFAEDGPELETRVFKIQFKSVDDVVLLVRNALGENGSLTLQPRLKAVIVTDDPALLDRVGQLIASFDVPPRQVRLAVQLLMGSHEETPEKRKAAPAAPRLPGIDRDLRNTLGLTSWTDYDLLGSATFTTAEGEESTLALGEDYRIRLKVGTVNDKQQVTRFERFALERRHIDESGQEELRAIWDQVLNLRDNQLYVFGATRLEDSSRAIFLSITAGIMR